MSPHPSLSITAPERAESDPGYLEADDLAARQEAQRLAYLATVRAGLSERLASVLLWLEETAEEYGQDAGGDPRFAPNDPRARDYGDPFVILDDVAARIEHSFNVGERDLGWRDGAMLGQTETAAIQASMDSAIYVLEHLHSESATIASAAASLRCSVGLLEQYRVRTQLGCTKTKPAAPAKARS